MTTLSCTRCGGEDVYPAPGPFGTLGALAGLHRHHCRECRRSFWARAGAEYARRDAASTDDLATSEPDDNVEPPAVHVAPSTESFEADERAAESEDALADAIDVGLLRPRPDPVDLSALDAEIARLCATSDARPHGRRRHGPLDRRRQRELEALEEQLELAEETAPPSWTRPLCRCWLQVSALAVPGTREPPVQSPADGRRVAQGLVRWRSPPRTDGR